jgi:hypothetical protein
MIGSFEAAHPHFFCCVVVRECRCPHVTDAGLIALSRLSRLHTLLLHGMTNITDVGLKALAKVASAWPVLLCSALHSFEF